MRFARTAILVAGLVAGCSHWVATGVAPSDLLKDPSGQNDDVRLFLRSGAPVELKQPRLAGDSIFGQLAGSDAPASVAQSDVIRIEVRRLDPLRTFVAIGASVLVVAVLAAGFSAFGTTSPPPPPSSPPLVSCPLVYSWDGNDWRLDSGTFGGAITRGLARTDVDNLDALVSVDGRLRIRVTNELPETDHIDRISLLAVDHPAGTMVAPDPAGNIHVLRDLAPPLGARDFRGHDALERVRRLDGWGWETTLGARDSSQSADTRDGLVLEFRRPASAAAAHLVLDANNTPWASSLLMAWVSAHGSGLQAWYDTLDTAPATARALIGRIADEAFLQVSLRVGDRWIRQALYWEAGPEVRKRQVVHLDLRGVAGDTIAVKLESPPAFWWIDQVTLGPADDRGITARPLSIAAAAGNAAREVRELLGQDDGRYLTLETGEAAELTFDAPPPSAGLERSYLLRSSGWYRVRSIDRAIPDVALLDAVNTPGGLSRLATAKLSEAVGVASRPR